MNKHIGILSLAVVLAAFAGFLVFNKHQQQGSLEKGLMLEGLKSSAANIDRIEIKKAHGLDFNATQQDGQWVAAALDNYPVEQTKLAKLITAMVEARQLQAKTSKPDYFDRLGLRAISDQDSLATQVTLYSGSKSWSVLVGQRPERSSGQYVRLPKNNQAWLVDKAFELPFSDTDWLKQPVLPTAMQDIQQLEKLGEKGWIIRKQDKQQPHFELADLAADRKLTYPGVLDAAVSSVTGLNFEAIAAADTVDWSQADKTTFNVSLYNGDLYQLDIATVGNDHYLTVSSDSLQGYWQHRTYKISSFSFEQLNKGMEDFLQKASDNVPMSGAVIDEGEAPK
ncbi:DUF4340 domain-containing protein [Neptunicella marina]|uniref:DUF4340 domain-containing protein n=1 Tax=Neptunicella marina TaxID=2125989 RepID=A0A8J6M2R6_9ALTE|nr:DUF4340 domain-containing protein [Neptunicella marina]MBC3766402.1 DUF4340 domain-containing protein [Neptunicella marina]